MLKLLQELLFTEIAPVYRTAVIGVLAYAVLVLFLRISGQRTLAKLNAFDLVVTVSLGSTLATILLNKSVALAEGATAFATLIALQFLVTWTSVRFRPIRRIVIGEPRMLLFRGSLLSSAMRKARITESEVLAALRAAGKASPQDAEAVVLETDGSISVIARQEQPNASPALDDVVLPDVPTGPSN